MKASHSRRAGFTLIELLVVIAVIGILAGFAAVVLPTVLEKAKVVEAENVANQLRALLTDYYAVHGTYPPAYGYIKAKEFGTPGIDINQEVDFGPPIVQNDFVTVPWMAALGEHGNLDLYDPFSERIDINLDDPIDEIVTPLGLPTRIEMLEYSPIGGHNPASYAAGEVDGQGFFTRVYNGVLDAVLDDDLVKQRGETKRPFLYFPINKRQFNRIKNEWPGGTDPRPKDDVSVNVNTNLAEMNFPPPTYDAYVLVSLGPYGHFPGREPLYGLLYNSVPVGSSYIDLTDNTFPYPTTLNGETTEVKQLYRYHYMAMATYYMLTRDAQDNDQLDFDFKTRTNGDEVAQKDILGNELNLFDDPDVQRSGGPLIFMSN